MTSLKKLASLIKSKDESDLSVTPAEEIHLYGIQKNASLSNIFKYKNMSGYKDQELLKKIITAAVVWFVEGFKEGGRMRTTDIIKFSDFLTEYYSDSLEDILLCFKMAEDGELFNLDTGHKIERYSSMSVELLKKYWLSYMDLKAQKREQYHNAKKRREMDGDFRTEEDTKIKQMENNKNFIAEMGVASKVYKNTDKGTTEAKFMDKIKIVTGSKGNE